MAWTTGKRVKLRELAQKYLAATEMLNVNDFCFFFLEVVVVVATVAKNESRMEGELEKRTEQCQQTERMSCTSDK